MALQINGNGTFSGTDITFNGTTLHQNGYVTSPNHPAFSVGILSNFTSASSGVTVNTWTSAINGGTNIGNHMGSTYFTAPIAGSYYFEVSVLFNSGASNNWCGTYIHVNDVMVRDSLGGSWQSGYDYQMVNRGTVLYLEANDQVSVQIRDDAGDGFIYAGAPYSWFSGYLIG